VSTTITQPYSYEPGQRITAQATAAVTERTFLAPSGNRAASGNLSVAPAAAGARAFGVAAYAAAVGQLVLVARGGVVKVTAGGTIAAGDPIAVGAGGTAVTATGTAVVVGLAVNGAANGAVAEVALYA
jgi:Uncharacterized conserved protein (DUF2190)